MRKVFHSIYIAIAALMLFGKTLETLANTSFPDKPIRIIATLSAGSQVDILTRIIAEKMSASMGQPVIVENVLGAGGTIAAARVANASADGYSLLVTPNGHAINPSLYDKLSFDTRKSFSGVSLIAVVPSVLVITNAGPKSVADLIAQARAKPGTITYASAGVGSASHLAAELFRTLAMIDITHIPYKGTAEMISDLVAGRIDFAMSPAGASNALIKDGKARGLAVTTTERSNLLPAVPTMAEAGVANYRFDFWYGIFAPAGTPKPVLEKLAAEVQKALAQPDVREKFAAQSATPSRVTLGAFDTFVATEIDRYAALVKSSGAKQGTN
jgi:tripartite-type tricarboxylate transporter receptor subunit TctC